MNFMPGLELNRRYYQEVVAPLLMEWDPKLHYSACLIGYGSDVLGFDDKTSMDHNWGPRLQLFVGPDEIFRRNEIKEYLRLHLPPAFLGFPTNFSVKSGDGTQRMENGTPGNINHLVEVYEIESYLHSLFNVGIEEMTNTDWLAIPEQKLLEFTGGSVFHDGLGKLNPVRDRLKYYPGDVRKIKLAAFWNCISNEEAFVGRMAECADSIGAKLIMSRIVNYLMKICFVLKEEYVPYSKWFTRKFELLNLPKIRQLSLKALQENRLHEMENRVADLYLAVIALQNESPDIPEVKNKVTTYYSRPYKVVMAGEIVEAIIETISDETLKKMNLSAVAVDNKIDSDDFTDGDLVRTIVANVVKG